MRALADRDAAVPPHLAGVPACLHKYEPLLKRAADAVVAPEPAEPAEAAAG